MNTIQEDEFYSLLYDIGKIEFRIINLSEINLRGLASIEFINCVFSKQVLIIDDDAIEGENENYKKITIKTCVFNGVHISKCNFSIFEVLDIKGINDFLINDCKIDTLRFLDCSNIDFGITFRQNVFNESFTFENNYFLIKGHLSFLNTNFNKLVIIKNNTFSILRFAFVKFKDFTAIIKNKFTNSLLENSFLLCEFEQIDFSQNDFRDMKYIDCKFLGSAKFKDVPYNKLSIISFDMCNFYKHVNFNKSSFYKLIFENGSFIETASFQDTYFDIISIDRTTFESKAFFDNIQIKKIDDCSRKTIRTIKQELQKAENKIDYNKFRVYEFNAYRNDIKNKLREYDDDKDHLNHRVREPIQLKRDAFVLWISDLVSEYGTDWKRALNFTFWSGLSIYSLFYLIENHNYTIEVSNWNNWSRFISGLFRFFLVTDFYNPLETDRVYLTNPLSWLIFIFGKIVIAFGIYEMIQSFRKFKA
ncbi:hypothetical protein [Flavobacterium sp.]|uniref:hypothetical protein n=1 Tax=Flavobacterium sp. TaxID=239 RepID=UPI0037517DD1